MNTMKLIFTIKYIVPISSPDNRTGSLALNTISLLGGVHLLDRFVNKAQEEKFRNAYSAWKPITIKKL